MGMQKAVASLVMGVVGILASFGIEIGDALVNTITVVLTTAAVYLIPNKSVAKKKKARAS